MLQKNAEQGNVKISYCNDDSFAGLSEFDVSFNQILHENDKEKYFAKRLCRKFCSFEKSSAFLAAGIKEAKRNFRVR